MRREGAGFVATARVPPGCAFFDGHFDGNPILPGVAHLELVLETARAALGRAVRSVGVRRLRFRRTLGPGDGVEVALTVQSDGAAMRFHIRDGGKDVSSGTLLLAPEIG